MEKGIVKPVCEAVSAFDVASEEVRAEAAMASDTVSDQGKAGAEAPAFSLGSTDPIALIQAGVDTEDLKLALHLREVELETKTREVELIHLRIRVLELDPANRKAPTAVSMPLSSTPEQFDVSRHIALVPQFRESEVDSYFNAFERIAATLKWPKDVWSLLL